MDPVIPGPKPQPAPWGDPDESDMLDDPESDDNGLDSE